MIRRFRKSLSTLLFGIAISSLTFVNTFALSAEQQIIYDSGIGYFDLVDEATCGPSNSTPASGDVYVLGDSLTVGMRDAGGLETKLKDVIKIEATVGDTISQGLAKLSADKENVSKAGTIVIALGTNPAGLTSDENVAKIIEKIKEADYAPNADIKWMNIHTKNNNWQPFNEFLKTQAAALNFEIIDFAAEAEANPANYPYAGDGVHLDAVGYSNKADFLVTSLGGSVGGAPAPDDGGETNLGDKNTGYNGEPIWTEEELTKVEQNKPMYVKAADEADIPWQMIATIHRNETGQRRENPSNGQGIYQFVDGRGGPYPAGPVDDAEFQRQTIFAAQFIQDKSQANHSANMGPLKVNGTAPNVIKDTFYSYNGRGGYDAQARAIGFTNDGEGFEGSPYVMNRADLTRDPTVEPTKSNGTWGQVKRDFGPIEYPANTFWGTWVLFVDLSGIDGGGGSSCGGEAAGGSGSVNADGYAFPVEPQTKKGNGGGFFSDLPCPAANCHTHTSFVAFDIGREPFANSTGAAVYAIYDGAVTGISIFETYQGCYEFTLAAKDGASYYYTHTSDVIVQEGQEVKAGDKLAQIGPQPCVDGGANPSAHQAHLHIQQIKGGTISPDLTPLMNEIFNGLPE